MTATLSVVTVPDIGDFADVPVIEILVAVGTPVAAEDPLVTLESDKATMDVPAPFAGVVREIAVSIGDRVSEGSALMQIETGGDPPASDTPSPDDEPAAPPHPAGGAAPADPPSVAAPQPEGGPPAGEAPYASPAVRRLARELGVDLHAVTGTGRKGRITKDDVSRPVTSPTSSSPGPAGSAGLDLLPWPTVNFEKFGPVERSARGRIQRISAANLARNWVMIPHVTHHDEADITGLEAWRQELNAERGNADVKFTMVSFLVAASVAALKAFPDFNASLDGDELVRKGYYNIGFAADTPGGLVVPVIKQADAKGLRDIALELTALSGQARAGKLSPGDMSGSTFTISSLGGIGGTAFSPIINAPEVAILGATRAAMRPLWTGSTFEPRLMLPLSMSYDHRVIDGAAAARFVSFLVRLLSDMRRVLL